MANKMELIWFYFESGYVGGSCSSSNINSSMICLQRRIKIGITTRDTSSNLGFLDFLFLPNKKRF